MTLKTSESELWVYRIQKISYIHDKEGNVKHNKSGEPIQKTTAYDYIVKDCWEAKLYERVTYLGISHRVIKIEKNVMGEPDKLIIVDAKEKTIPTINRLTVLN